MKKLNAQELTELRGLFDEYYLFEQVGKYSLGRMYELEGRASEAQLNQLLKKYNRTTEEEFA